MRALFLADGRSDLPLAQVLTRLMDAAGVSCTISPISNDQLRTTVPSSEWSLRVQDRLQIALKIDSAVDAVFIHRDAERRPSVERHQEVADASQHVNFGGSVVAIVPVRMTEAWLLLDHAAIRTVAGNPAGTDPLELPRAAAIEGLPDPKKILAEALVRAAGNPSGRRRKQLTGQFGVHRRQLIERLDIDGAVTRLPSWRAMVGAVEECARMIPE